jgi:short-chain fatty acids transporter
MKRSRMTVPARQQDLWGDLGTALIQPFWAIALLAIVRLRFGQIMGYCLVIWVPFSIVATIGMFLMPIH